MMTPPRIIGLTGTNGSGKSEVAAYFKARGYTYLSLSDILREELRLQGLDITRDNLIRAGNDLRETQGPDILARRTMAKVAGPTVIDSIRNSHEVDFFRKQKDFFFIAVDAPLELRHQRVTARGRDESASTLEEFRKKEEEEMAGGRTGQQLSACMAMADLLIINDGTIAELNCKLEGLI